MADIVDRLQEHGYLCCGEHYERDAYCRSCVLHAEAAAEIERLCADRDRWQATAAGLSQDMSNAADEIERLRAEIADWQRTVRAQESVAEALRAVMAKKHAKIEQLINDRNKWQDTATESLNNEKYAVLLHSRWLETEEPKATVIRSFDGHTWHKVCSSDPETAREIAEAMLSKK